ncbi:hypothetical protein [Microbacterium sp. bgisy189]|uniref:hypothetical protein n=1 Tax=Microbacterium sp. bgisy189 TaxID=3413798 RepID=UPI003EBADF0D
MTNSVQVDADLKPIRTLRKLTIAAWIIEGLCVLGAVLIMLMNGHIGGLAVAGTFLPVAFIVTAINEHAKVNAAIAGRTRVVEPQLDER